MKWPEILPEKTTARTPLQTGSRGLLNGCISAEKSTLSDSQNSDLNHHSLPQIGRLRAKSEPVLARKSRPPHSQELTHRRCRPANIAVVRPSGGGQKKS